MDERVTQINFKRGYRERPKERGLAGIVKDPYYLSIRIVPKANMIAKCQGAKKKYFVDLFELCPVKNSNRLRWGIRFIGHKNRFHFDTLDEARELILKLKKEFGSKGSKLNIKRDDLGVSPIIPTIGNQED